MESFDLVVIGSGPGGQRCAVQAAKLGKKVALIERRHEMGGVCINTGTIPSKTMKEAVLDLSGMRQRRLYGEEFAPKRRPTAEELLARVNEVSKSERDIIHQQLKRNGIHMLTGNGRFAAPHTIQVEDGDEITTLQAANVAIAVGTVPGLPAGIEVDHQVVLTSDDLLRIQKLPRQMMVVGAGIIGLEYGSMLAALGVEVTLLDMRTQLLEMVDREIVDAFAFHAREMGLTFRLGEQVESIQTTSNGQAVITMKSGKRTVAECVLVSAGRQGATDGLQLEKAGLEADSRGRITVNEHFQTKMAHIYAVGDVVGFPSLASTSAEQGRHAACHMFQVETRSMPTLYPFGIYAIPEISWVGQTEAELTQAGVPYETGVARYKEIARGHILGDQNGMLKIIFHIDTKKILGVWCMGTQATELVHIGQAVMALDGSLDYFVGNVFNYPTLAECYKVAALNGFNKLRALGDASQYTQLPCDIEDRKAA
ncbi:MAG: Si-specific NAD(P)(+) transhydrogenase [Candidatus Eisenbacteria bacterium]|nr:Si-specific NAD(P)(+) transhydrogenase [Candidatus Eisenbacteria bacterium]